MKKAGSRIILALIIALTAVIGSVSPASAARPVRVVADIMEVNSSSGFRMLYSWEKISVVQYHITITDITSEPLTVYTYESLAFEKTRAYTDDVWVQPNVGTTPPNPIHSYSVELIVYLVKGGVETASGYYPN